MNNKNKNILISLILIVISYWLVSAWTNLSTVTNWTALTATVWNDMVTKVNETGNRVSWISTDWSSNVWIWTTTPTAKLQVSWWTTILQQEAWQTPTFQNSWANYGSTFAPVGYFKDSMWVVHLRWLTNLWTIWVCIFTLPVWYRPTYKMLYVNISNAAVWRIDIDTSWCVVAAIWSNLRFSLDWITFATH